MTTETFRINSQLEITLAAIQRIELIARNGGNLEQVARECESVQNDVLAITSADTDGQIADLIAARSW